MTAMIWKGKQDMYILINLHRPPTEGKFCDKHGKTHKPVIVEDYSWHMGCVNIGDRMADTYLVRQHGSEQKKKKNSLLESKCIE
jgi:hypothetical protein